MIAQFDYIPVSGNGYKPKQYIGIPYVHLPAILLRDVERILSLYTLDNFCTPTITYLIHSLLKLENYRDPDVFITLEKDTVFRRRSFNIDIKYLDLIPNEKQDIEKLFTGLLYKSLQLHLDGKLKEILESC